MHQGMLVFAQVMTYLPLSTFRRCVAAHRGDHKVQGFSCLDQFFAMSFAQLTGRESLRDIEVNLRAQSARLYHMGFRCKTISRNTLANANAPGALPMEVRQVQDVGTHVILSAVREGALVKARLAPDSTQLQVGDTVWLQVMGSHTCFYKNEEIVA